MLAAGGEDETDTGQASVLCSMLRAASNGDLAGQIGIGRLPCKKGEGEQAKEPPPLR